MYKIAVIIVITAKAMNGNVSKPLSAITVAKAVSVGEFEYLPSIYALTGSPPPFHWE